MTVVEHEGEDLDSRTSVINRQRRDHAALDELLQELSASDPMDMPKILLRIYRLVFPHAFAEETVLWPVIRRKVPGGEALTLRVEQEHQEVNELVTALELMSPGDPAWRPTVQRLDDVLRSDVRHEEDVLLPSLQSALSARDVQRLGVAWEVVRRTAPTRAHPIVARRPPGNVLAALPLSIVDRLRDGVDLLRQRSNSQSGALTSTSRQLTALAHRIERAPLLSRGEDPSTHRRRSAG